MALKNVKTESAGGKHKSRWVTRWEAKSSARKARRAGDRKATSEAS